MRRAVVKCAITSRNIGTPTGAGAANVGSAGVKRHRASTRASSSAVRAETGPLASVVRSSVASWMTTGTPSAERRTSHSKPSAPFAIARVKASAVFSGPIRAPPRCPNTSGRPPAKTGGREKPCRRVTAS